MATTYEVAAHDDPARTLLDHLLTKYRGDLDGVRIEVLWALGENGKAALRKDGQVVYGRCRINSLQDRAEGKADVTITLDQRRWQDMSPDRKAALIHHELCHIDRWDRTTCDDLGRPALRIRHGDWAFDGFHEIVDRYGLESIEAMNLSVIAEVHRQLQLPFTTTTEGAA